MKRNEKKEPLYEEFEKYRKIKERIAPFLPREENNTKDTEISGWSSPACQGAAPSDNK